MKSQIETSSRAACANSFLVSVLVILAAACSGGRSALSTEPVGASTNSASTSDKSDLPACGSMTKPCDPKNLGGQTCSMMGMGTGTLMCDPVTCSFDTSNCTLSGNTGGGGLGALLGAFGRNQGGRAAMGMGQAAGGRGGRAAMSNSGRGGAQGQREDDQEAEAGGRGGEAGESDPDDQDGDEEGGRGGEGGSTGASGASSEGGSSGENPDAGGAGGEGGQSGEGGAGEGGESADAPT